MKDADWPDIAAFLAVLRHGTLAGAAAVLHTSVPTLGRRIAGLERQLGVTLFLKGTKGYRPTEAALRLAASADQVEAAIDRLLRERDALGTDIAGTVRVAAPETLVTYVLAPALKHLLEHYPGLTVEFLVGPLPAALPRREADLAVRLGQRDEGNLYARRLGTLRSVLFAPPDAPADLKAIRWVGWGEAFAALPVNRLTLEALDERNRVATSNSLETQLALAHALQAAVVLPDYMAGRAHPLSPRDGLVVILPVWLVSSAEVRLMPRIRATSSFLERCIKAGMRERSGRPSRA